MRYFLSAFIWALLAGLDAASVAQHPNGLHIGSAVFFGIGAIVISIYGAVAILVGTIRKK